METVAIQEIPSGEGLTLEKLWAYHFASKAEYDRRQAELTEQMRETAAHMRETDERMRKTDERLDKIGRQLGDIGNNLGEMIETLVSARLWEKFADFPYGFERAYRRVQVFNGSEELTDIDILLSNGEWVMAVEVKRKVRAADVKGHVSRMGKIREFPPAEARDKKLLGAIAGAVVEPAARDMAHKNGFFVIEMTGDTAALAPRPQDFQPREW